MILHFLWVALGGALGAVLRVMIQNWLVAPFPWATLLVNVLGSFLAGVLMATELSVNSTPSITRSLLVFGFCGAFTTFSTFSHQTYLMFEAGDYFKALSNIGSSLLLGLLAVYCGLRMVRG